MVFILNLFLKHKIIASNHNNYYALKCASDSGSYKIIKILLVDEPKIPTKEDYSALSYAIRSVAWNNYSKLVYLFVNRYNIDITMGKYSLLICAIINYNYNLFNFLLNRCPKNILPPYLIKEAIKLGSSKNDYGSDYLNVNFKVYSCNTRLSGPKDYHHKNIYNNIDKKINYDIKNAKKN